MSTVRTLARELLDGYLESLTLDALVVEGVSSDQRKFAEEWKHLVAAALEEFCGGKLTPAVAALYQELSDRGGDSQRFDALCAIEVSNRDAGFALGLELGRRLGK